MLRFNVDELFPFSFKLKLSNNLCVTSWKKFIIFVTYSFSWLSHCISCNICVFHNTALEQNNTGIPQPKHYSFCVSPVIATYQLVTKFTAMPVCARIQACHKYELTNNNDKSCYQLSVSSFCRSSAFINVMTHCYISTALFCPRVCFSSK